MTNKETFLRLYTAYLTEAKRLYPNEWFWEVERAPHIANVMTNALATGSANKNSPVIRRVCKHLSIPYTYKGIKAYLNA